MRINDIFPEYIVVRSDSGASVKYLRTKFGAKKFINREVNKNKYFDSDECNLIIEKAWLGKLNLC